MIFIRSASLKITLNPVCDCQTNKATRTRVGVNTGILHT